MNRRGRGAFAPPLLVVGLGLLGACSDEAAVPPAADGVSVRALVERQMTEYLAVDPELATSVGLAEDRAGEGYAGRLVDYSPTGERFRRAMFARFVGELDAIDPGALERDERVTREVARSIWGGMVTSRGIAYGRQYPLWYYGHTPYVVNQISGPHIDIPNLMTSQQSVADAGEAYLQRLRAFGPTFAGIGEKLRADAELGVTPPRVLVERTLEVLDGILATEPDDHDLVVTLGPKLDAAGFSEDERARILAAATEAVAAVVLPAYAELRAVIAELLPLAREEHGVWSLPDGEAFYRAAIRSLGGSDRTPDEIHEIGLAEVERISGEIDALLAEQGMREGTVGERLAALGEDPRFRYEDSDAGRARLIADLNGQVEEISALMPDYFATIPPQEVEVRRIPEFSEATAPGGYYEPPSLDGSRPGYYNVNLRDMASVPSWTLKTLTYHEALPGHHHQIATAYASGEQPLIRRLSPLNAYTEGWALYAEQLAWEMGLYAEDPFGDVGRLADELFRAVRLVVDTGMHHRRWSREEAIDYMARTTGSAPSEVRAEIERYLAWPGQALGYKLGMLRILELREEASARLGDAFDLAAFHDRVLTGGAVPMEVLEAELERWVEAHPAG